MSEQAISTAFLADSSASRIKVMEKMNQIAREASPVAASAQTRLQVIRGMNGLTSPDLPVGVQVMRAMNRLSPDAP